MFYLTSLISIILLSRRLSRRRDQKWIVGDNLLSFVVCDYYDYCLFVILRFFGRLISFDKRVGVLLLENCDNLLLISNFAVVFVSVLLKLIEVGRRFFYLKASQSFVRYLSLFLSKGLGWESELEVDSLFALDPTKHPFNLPIATILHPLSPNLSSLTTNHPPTTPTKMSTTAANPLQVLTPGIGYGIVIGIGGFFTLLMLLLTYVQNRYTAYSTHGAEEFTTASRSVKPGLIAAGIVSSWSEWIFFDLFYCCVFRLVLVGLGWREVEVWRWC